MRDGGAPDSLAVLPTVYKVVSFIMIAILVGFVLETATIGSYVKVNEALYLRHVGMTEGIVTICVFICIMIPTLSLSYFGPAFSVFYVFSNEAVSLKRRLLLISCIVLLIAVTLAELTTMGALAIIRSMLKRTANTTTLGYSCLHTDVIYALIVGVVIILEVFFVSLILQESAYFLLQFFSLLFL